MSTTTTSNPTVLLIGGPDDWHRQSLTHLSAEELAGNPEELGVLLASEHVPLSNPDAGARSDYSPDLDGSPRIWHFRGWTPAGAEDPENRRAQHHHPADVTLDADGLPTSWTDDQDARHQVDRELAHWEASPQEGLGYAVWHVRSDGSDYELRAHPNHWEVGRLPDLEEHAQG